MEAAYGPQDKTVCAACVAFNLHLMGHGVADPGRPNRTIFCCSGSVGHGGSALVAPRHGLSLNQGAPQPSQANLSRRLMQHQINLHQRSEAESLLMEFTLAQMTRYY